MSKLLMDNRLLDKKIEVFDLLDIEETLNLMFTDESKITISYHKSSDKFYIHSVTEGKHYDERIEFYKKHHPSTQINKKEHKDES